MKSRDGKAISAVGKTKFHEGKAKSIAGRVKSQAGKAKFLGGKAESREGKIKSVVRKGKSHDGKGISAVGKTKFHEGKVKSLAGKGKSQAGKAKSLGGKAKSREGKVKSFVGKGKSREGKGISAVPTNTSKPMDLAGSSRRTRSGALIRQVARLQYLEMMFSVTPDQIRQSAYCDGIVVGRTAACPGGRIQVTNQVDRGAADRFELAGGATSLRSLLPTYFKLFRIR